MTPPSSNAPILLVDFGSTYTKITAVDLAQEVIIARAKSPTTIKTDIMEGFNNAFAQIADTTGIADVSGFETVFAASSAGGGLRIIASGLVPDLTAHAAQMAALNAGGKIIKTFSFELNEQDIDEIIASQPDIVLLTGGTDGGNRKMLLENAAAIAAAAADFTVVLLCNRNVAQEAATRIRASGKKVVVTENVMPKLDALNIDPARAAIRALFLEDIIKAKGLSHVQHLIEGILMPTPSAVMLAVELLSKGVEGEAGLGETLTLDVGGATTDIYSAIEGLPKDPLIFYKGFIEPYIKRTVEGDLGLRHNADHIIHETGMAKMMALCAMKEDDINQILDRFKQDAAVLPQTDKERQLDKVMGQQAIAIAVRRHAGQLRNQYTSEGAVTIQVGKDLSDVKYVIGTGGPILHESNARDLLAQSLFDHSDPTALCPKNPRFLLDEHYILSAMGILSVHYPLTALRMMKNNLLEL